MATTTNNCNIFVHLQPGQDDNLKELILAHFEPILAYASKYSQTAIFQLLQECHVYVNSKRQIDYIKYNCCEARHVINNDIGKFPLCLRLLFDMCQHVSLQEHPNTIMITWNGFTRFVLNISHPQNSKVRFKTRCGLSSMESVQELLDRMISIINTIKIPNLQWEPITTLKIKCYTLTDEKIIDAILTKINNILDRHNLPYQLQFNISRNKYVLLTTFTNFKDFELGLLDDIDLFEQIKALLAIVRIVPNNSAFDAHVGDSKHGGHDVSITHNQSVFRFNLQKIGFGMTKFIQYLQRIEVDFLTPLPKEVEEVPEPEPKVTSTPEPINLDTRIKVSEDKFYAMVNIMLQSFLEQTRHTELSSEKIALIMTASVKYLQRQFDIK